MKGIDDVSNIGFVIRIPAMLLAPRPLGDEGAYSSLSGNQSEMPVRIGVRRL